MVSKSSSKVELIHRLRYCFLVCIVLVIECHEIHKRSMRRAGVELLRLTYEPAPPRLRLEDWIKACACIHLLSGIHIGKVSLKGALINLEIWEGALHDSIFIGRLSGWLERWLIIEDVVVVSVELLNLLLLLFRCLKYPLYLSIVIAILLTCCSNFRTTTGVNLEFGKTLSIGFLWWLCSLRYSRCRFSKLSLRRCHSSSSRYFSLFYLFLFWRWLHSV